jgi:hypothetical protein
LLPAERALERVIVVEDVARDDVDVQLRDELARCLAGVEADVVSVWVELGVEGSFDLGYELHERLLFFQRRVEPRPRCALQENDRVARVDRVEVADGVGPRRSGRLVRDLPAPLSGPCSSGPILAAALQPQHLEHDAFIEARNSFPPRSKRVHHKDKDELHRSPSREAI